MLKKFIISSFLLFVFGIAFADTILLKSGQKIEGAILEDADKYIKINFSGVDLIYYKDQIAQINGKEMLVFGARPSVNKNQGQDLVTRGFELAGADKIFSRFVSSYNAGLIGMKDKVDPQAQAIADKAMLDESFTEELYSAAAGYFSSRLDQPKLIAALGWLGGPLGKKISALESQGVDSPQAQKELEKITLDLQNNNIPEQRLILMRKLDSLTNSSEILIDLVVAAVDAVSKTIEPVLPEDKRLKPGELEDMRAELVAPLSNQIVTGFIFTYRSLSDKELAEYVDFCESPSGGWFLRAINESLKKAFNFAGEKVSTRIRPEIDNYLKNELKIK